MNWQCCRTFFSCFSGFLRSDVLIGTVLVKLQPLETASEIHDSFDVSFIQKWGEENIFLIYFFF